MSLKSTIATSQALESELNKERAGALGRTGRELEARLEECQALRVKLAQAAPSLRNTLLEDYRVARAEAQKWLWYLCVQREAMGVRRHDDVYATYPLPPMVGDV